MNTVMASVSSVSKDVKSSIRASFLNDIFAAVSKVGSNMEVHRVVNEDFFFVGPHGKDLHFGVHKDGDFFWAHLWCSVDTQVVISVQIQHGELCLIDARVAKAEVILSYLPGLRPVVGKRFYFLSRVYECVDEENTGELASWICSILCCCLHGVCDLGLLFFSLNKKGLEVPVYFKVSLFIIIIYYFFF